MGVVEELVARIPGAVLALDEGLTVLASSQGSEEGRRLLPADVLGRPCYEALSLVDAVPLSEGIYTSPVVADGRIYVVDGSGKAHAIDAKTLKTVWNYQSRRSTRPYQAARI